MGQKLKVGLIPMTSTDRVDVNLSKITESLEHFEMPDQRVDLICLPENTFYFNFKNKIEPQDVITLEHSAFKTLEKWSKDYNTSVHVGGTPLLLDGQIYNASILIFPGMSAQVVYKKIHLFDVNVEGRKVSESESFKAGEELSIIDINGWKLGLTICYDLRFAELYIGYHRQKVDGILVPSSFLVPTGRAHWQTLLRARAIETQAFIIATAQAGIHSSQLISEAAPKQTWGESLVFDPWGHKLAGSLSFDELSQSDPSEKPFTVELDRTLIEKARQQIPLLNHRKLRF